MTTTPTVGRVPTGGRWGKRKAPKPGASTFHRGVDVAAPAGTPIIAPEAGTAVVVSFNSARGWYVVLQHGRYRTLHQHMQLAPPVRVGQDVTEGQVIGYVGATGTATGPHLHTEVHDGVTPIDPDPWYAARGVALGAATTHPQEVPTVRIIRGIERPEVWATDGITKRHIATDVELAEELRVWGQAEPLVVGQFYCDRIPVYTPAGPVDVKALAAAVPDALPDATTVTPDELADELAARLTS